MFWPLSFPCGSVSLGLWYFVCPFFCSCAVTILCQESAKSLPPAGSLLCRGISVTRSIPSHSMNSAPHTKRWPFAHLDSLYSPMTDTILKFWFYRVFVWKILNGVPVMSCQCLSMCCACCHCSSRIRDSWSRDHDVCEVLSAVRRNDYQYLWYLLASAHNIRVFRRSGRGRERKCKCISSKIMLTSNGKKP